MNKYNKELEDSILIANSAGEILMQYYDAEYNVYSKENEENPAAAILTEVDLKVNQLIRDFYIRKYPNDQLLTEETVPDVNWYKSKRIWIIDPLDGTMGYKKKTGFFGVSIALVEDGEPVLGVIYAPIMDILAYAVKGEGTVLNNQKIDISNKKEINTLLCSSNSMKKPEYQELLKTINPDNKFNIIKLESFVAKVLLLLTGQGEIYPILPKIAVPNFWDIAASDVILSEAGAKLTNFYNQKFKYNIPNFKCEDGVLVGTVEGHNYVRELCIT